MRNFRISSALPWALVLAAGVSLSACADDDPIETPVDCEATPNAPECIEEEVDCEATPNAPECIEEEVDCEETPDDPACVVACEDELNNLILAAINPQETLYRHRGSAEDYDLDSLLVEEIDEYVRVLQFQAGGSPGVAQQTSRLYLDLDTDQLLKLTDVEALENTEWDIAFDNVGYVYTNSLQSGPGGLRFAKVENERSMDAFVALAQPARSTPLPWKQDRYFDADTCEELESRFLGVDYHDSAIGAWFAYDPISHTTDPEPNAYIVYNSPDNHHIYKIQFLSYDGATQTIELAVGEFPDCEDTPDYPACDVSEPVDCDENPDHEDCAVAPLCTDDDIDDLVWQTLQPKELAADIPAIETVDHDGYVVYEFDASYGDTPTANASSWLYLNLHTGELLDISDVESLERNDWHLAIKREEIRTNSGNSGPNQLRTARLEGVEDFETMEEPGQGGAQFLTDSFIDADTCEVIQPAGGRPDGYYTAFGNWYDYNPNGNIVSAPENVVFYMYDFSAGHQRYKIQIVDYTAGVYQIAFGVF